MSSMTVGEVLLRVRDQLGESSITTGFWQDNLLHRYIYDACVEMALDCSVTQTRTTLFTTVTGTREYSLTTGLFKVMHMTWDTQKVSPIDFTQFTRETSNEGTSSVVSGAPNYYYIFGQAGLSGIMGFQPIPDKSAPVVAYYIRIPDTTPASYTSSTLLEIPWEYGHLIQNYVLWKAWNKEHSAEGSRQSADNRAMWQDGLARVRRMQQERLRGDRFKVVKDVDYYYNTNYGIL
mgnify:CR=1 FL=1